MGKYNSEGYYDSVTRVAAEKKKRDFRTFDGFRPLVYICSPYAGDTVQNTKNARRYSRFALERNTIPLAPHLLYPQFMVGSDPAERRLAQHKINYVLVGKCDELWVFGGVISSGMEREISVAERRKMRIRYFTDELKEVMR